MWLKAIYTTCLAITLLLAQTSLLMAHTAPADAYGHAHHSHQTSDPAADCHTAEGADEHGDRPDLAPHTGGCCFVSCVAFIAVDASSAAGTPPAGAYIERVAGQPAPAFATLGTPPPNNRL